MRMIASFAAVLAVVGASVALAGDMKSGLQPGEELGPFSVTKCAGAPSDGQENGSNFCYRCMLGEKPVVMVFSHKADTQLASLVKELDKVCSKNEDKKLSSFVNLLGKDKEALKTQAKEFGEKNKPAKVAIVVPNDNENGPASYKLSPDAEVTVLIYREGKVAANHAFAAGKLDAKGIESIIADTSKILN